MSIEKITTNETLSPTPLGVEWMGGSWFVNSFFYKYLIPKGYFF
jgi:hypothetical protein